jgi:D-alanyl-D-alanine carboxypeptidase
MTGSECLARIVLVLSIKAAARLLLLVVLDTHPRPTRQPQKQQFKCWTMNNIQISCGADETSPKNDIEKTARGRGNKRPANTTTTPSCRADQSLDIDSDSYLIGNDDFWCQSSTTTKVMKNRRPTMTTTTSDGGAATTTIASGDRSIDRSTHHNTI